MLDFALVAFASLLSVVDPLGALPAYLVMTAGDEPAKQRRTAAKATLVACLTMALFGWSGGLIFHLLGISLPAFRIAGGLILFLVALEMMRARRPTQEGPGEVAEGTAKEDAAITPLAIPMLAGPASLSTVALLVSQSDGWRQLAIVYGAIAATGLLTYVTLLSAIPLFRWLGRSGIHVLSRVLGLLLASIAVQFILDGLRAARIGM